MTLQLLQNPNKYEIMTNMKWQIQNVKLYEGPATFIDF